MTATRLELVQAREGEGEVGLLSQVHPEGEQPRAPFARLHIMCQGFKS